MAKQTFTTGQVLTAAQMTSLQQTAMGGGSATAKTSSYVLVAADAGTTVAMNAAGATTITVNTGLFAAGDTVFIQNLGAGACTVTAGTATVATAGSLILPQNDAGILYFTATGASIFYDYIQAGAVSPLTTKGDVYTFSTSDARLGVGANNTVLTADSAEATGLKWATPAGNFNPFLIAKVTGSYLAPSFLSALADNRSSVEDVTLYTPIFITSASFDRIAIRTGSSHTGTGTIRLGLYNMDATTFRPSTLVFDAGTVTANAAATNFEITISQTVSTTGYYYLAFNVQNSTGNTRFYGHGGSVPLGVTSGATILSTFDENTGPNSQKGFKETGVTGAFTTAGTLTQNPDPMPLIGMRYA